MKPFPSLFVRLRPIITLGSMLALFMFLSACGGGSTSSGADGGIIATGRALVAGNVASSTLPGDLKDIRVTIQNRSTTTNSAGAFQLDDVPSGDQKMVFSKGGKASSLPLTLQSQSITTLSNVHINNDSVSTEKVEVDDHSSAVRAEDTEESVEVNKTEQADDDDHTKSSDAEEHEPEELKEVSSETNDDDDTEEDENDEEDDEQGQK